MLTPLLQLCYNYLIKKLVKFDEFLTLCTVLWWLYIENQKHISNFWIYDEFLTDKQLSIWRIVQNQCPKLVLKRTVFFSVQLWRLVSLLPVGVQRRAVPHFKDLFKIFKMKYSMLLYSNGIIFKFRFQKSRFTHKNRKWADTFLSHCTYNMWWLYPKQPGICW